MVGAEGAAVVAGVAVVGDAVVDVEVGGEELGGTEGFYRGAEGLLKVLRYRLRRITPKIPLNPIIRRRQIPN